MKLIAKSSNLALDRPDGRYQRKSSRTPVDCLTPGKEYEVIDIFFRIVFINQS